MHYGGINAPFSASFLRAVRRRILTQRLSSWGYCLDQLKLDPENARLRRWTMRQASAA